jgi:hypothetical protein
LRSGLCDQVKLSVSCIVCSRCKLEHIASRDDFGIAGAMVRCLTLLIFESATSVPPCFASTALEEITSVLERLGPFEDLAVIEVGFWAPLASGFANSELVAPLEPLNGRCAGSAVFRCEPKASRAQWSFAADRSSHHACATTVSSGGLAALDLPSSAMFTEAWAHEPETSTIAQTAQINDCFFACMPHR